MPVPVTLLFAFALSCSEPIGGERTTRPRQSDPDPPDDSAPDDSAPDDSASDDSASDDSGTAGPVQLTYPDRRVGMFYLTWHTYAAQAQAARTSGPATIEDVIAAGGTPAAMLYDAGLFDAAQAFHYHQEPELGFYCLYRQDADSTSMPDCPDIETTARTHATQLWEAGVDFVYVDLTNVPGYSDFSDVLGLRPIEVLFEEWGRLRRSGVPTPQIVPWVNLSATGDGSTPMVRKVLALRDSVQDDLWFAPDGVPALFYVAGTSADPALVEEIRAAGVTPVPLWGNLGADRLAAGDAGWMQPCTTGGDFTTRIAPDVPCDQGYTTTSPLGTVLSVSRSYQIGYASLPWQASGRYDGLTFQKQMETAFAVQPDILLVNAWNEHIAQPQANPYDSAYGVLRRSMGLTANTDATADWLWVDMYGADYNRDFEPTVQDGGAGLALLESCLRVYATGARTCDDAGESCCQLGSGRTFVYSVRPSSTATSGDHVPTVERAEFDALLASGWTEACSPIYAPPGLCAGTTADGPFGLYPEDGADRLPVYRCYTGVGHLMTNDPGCEGTTYERLLGYAAASPSSAMPRRLTRCYNRSERVHLHWLDAPCPAGVEQEGALGYVQ